ncbi:DUF3263 domain-containing protein [Micromonospora rifamycinica]|uniref:DUF3263 domain-containing protein n=1 Tax=Micromonospora rifamycinica TaxID=291594 RepID=UPI002E2BA230|nr:DUF3263 domain-containing protein [Micromonospora rifamycinica]
MPPADAMPPAKSVPSVNAEPPAKSVPSADVEASADVELSADGMARSGASPEPVDAPQQASSVPSPRAAPDDERTGERAAPAGADELTEREQRILAFEQQWWRHAGAKEQAIRDTFGLSATRYYQLLNGLLDRPAALVAEPLLIGRLRRLRASRTRNRRR